MRQSITNKINFHPEGTMENIGNYINGLEKVHNSMVAEVWTQAKKATVPHLYNCGFKKCNNNCVYRPACELVMVAAQQASKGKQTVYSCNTVNDAICKFKIIGG